VSQDLAALRSGSLRGDARPLSPGKGRTRTAAAPRCSPTRSFWLDTETGYRRAAGTAAPALPTAREGPSSRAGPSVSRGPGPPIRRRALRARSWSQARRPPKVRGDTLSAWLDHRRPGHMAGFAGFERDGHGRNDRLAAAEGTTRRHQRPSKRRGIEAGVPAMGRELTEKTIPQSRFSSRAHRELHEGLLHGSGASRPPRFPGRKTWRRKLRGVVIDPAGPRPGRCHAHRVWTPSSAVSRGVAWSPSSRRPSLWLTCGATSCSRPWPK